MKPSQFEISRTRETIHPYVEQDLRQAKVASLHEWVEAAFKLPKDKLDDWASKISAQKWFEDKVIQRCLIDYCRADAERQRYEPFSELANRIVQLARGNLPGVPKTESYPINDFCFVNNANRPIATIPEHGELGAVRRPDVLNLTGSAARRLADKGKIEWVDVLLWWELKYRLNLVSVLNDERVSRRMGPLNSDSGLTIPIRRSGRTKQASGSTKRPVRSRPSKNDPASTAVKAGVKRLREENLLDGLALCSSNKMRDRASAKYNLYLGKEAAVQSGSYALDLLSCTYGTRVFCFGVVLKDDRLFLWYYDASGVVYTTQYLSIINDFEKSAGIIVALARCTPEQLGALPASVMTPHIPYRRNFPPPNLSNSILSVCHPVDQQKVRLKLKEALFSQYVLMGRRTFIYTVETSSVSSPTGLVAKFSYQVHTRKSEHDLLMIARKVNVRHLPQIHMWADLWKLSEGTRRIFFQGSSGQARYEDRILRMIIYTKYDSIKSLFSQRYDLIPVMVEQMLDCLHDLRYKANMLHRDVSVNNVMYEMRGDKFHFILIDFDMAVVLPHDNESSYAASSNHRTGTLPFMAWELIKDAWRASTIKNWKAIPHLLRHDYESLFWLALWCVLTLLTHTVDDVEKDILLGRAKAWEARGLDLIAGSKESICAHSLAFSGINLPPPAQCLSSWFLGWTQLFRKSNAAVGDHEVERLLNQSKPEPTPLAPFDEETAGGTFSKDALNEVLIPLMPFRQSDGSTDAPINEIARSVEEDRQESPPAEAPKAERQTRKKVPSAEVAAVRARILSRLRPRKKAA